MECLEMDSTRFLSIGPPYGGSFRLEWEDGASVDVSEVSIESASTMPRRTDASRPTPPPPPPPPPSRTLNGCSYAIEKGNDVWKRLFEEGYGADVHVVTDDNCIVSAHSCVLGVSSPVLRNMLEQARCGEGFRCIRIPGVPVEAARAFIRFLYSSRYEQDVMGVYVFHLLLMSHAFSVPSLKKACTNQLEQSLLTTENAVDVLQLARECDAPRLSLLCFRLIIKDFKTISTSEGWKVMKYANPILEQEILEYLVEADSRRQEQVRKREEKKVYMQLYEAMEALLHICLDGCRTIGPRHKKLKDSQDTCSFPACKGIESLVRHFWGCKSRIPGRCVQCKRIWQIFELHSCMCRTPESCMVPLCRHFKNKLQCQNKKEQLKWKLLVRKVLAAKGTISSISAWRSCIA